MTGAFSSFLTVRSFFSDTMYGKIGNTFSQMKVFSRWKNFLKMIFPSKQLLLYDADFNMTNISQVTYILNIILAAFR